MLPLKNGSAWFKSDSLRMKTLYFFVIALCTSFSTQANEPWLLNSKGYGPVKVGMTIAEAESLLKFKLNTFENKPLDSECDYVSASGRHEGLDYMIQQGKISRIEVSDHAIKTKSGAKVGDSTSKLKELFGSQLEIERHKYDDTGFYYYIWEIGKRHGVKFEIAADKVRKIYVGDESIDLVEGCF
ncbi:hypothetical protein [Simplicispira metamorpha]|nr:hypothetical protein [Simplicispira metamorpha]